MELAYELTREYTKLGFQVDLSSLNFKLYSDWLISPSNEYHSENQSKERVAFGKPLTGLQQVRHTLAEVKTDCMFSRVVTDQLIEAYANDDMDQQTVSMAKVKFLLC